MRGVDGTCINIFAWNLLESREQRRKVIAKYRRAGEKRRARGDPDRRGRPGADADDNEDDRLVCCHLFPRYDG